MARPIKTGLDYFPLNVDFFEDDKIAFVSARFGIKGEIITIKLLSKIYRNSFWMKFSDDDALLFAKRAGEGITPALVNDVVIELVKRDFFNEDIFNSFSVLTSKGIQKRYFNIVERRKEYNFPNEYIIKDNLGDNLINVDNNSINVDINPINVDIKYTKERKEKERKVNERKERKEDNSLSFSFLNFKCKDKDKIISQNEYFQLVEKYPNVNVKEKLIQFQSKLLQNDSKRPIAENLILIIEKRFAEWNLENNPNQPIYAPTPEDIENHKRLDAAHERLKAEAEANRAKVLKLLQEQDIE